MFEYNQDMEAHSPQTESLNFDGFSFFQFSLL